MEKDIERSGTDDDAAKSEQENAGDTAASDTETAGDASTEKPGE